MKVEKTSIPGVVEIYPDVFNDERGYFFEIFRDTIFHNEGLPSIFRQINQVKSLKNELKESEKTRSELLDDLEARRYSDSTQLKENDGA